MNGKTAKLIAAALAWYAIASAGCTSLELTPRAPWNHDGSVRIDGFGIRGDATYIPPGHATEPTSPSAQAPPPHVEGPSPEAISGPRIIPQGVSVPATLVLAVNAPARKQVGSDAVFRLTIQNIGDKPADDVVVESEFDEALDFPGRREKKVRQSLGRIVAQESKEIVLTLVSDQVGKHCCRFTLFSKGKEAVWKSVCVAFLPRQLDIEIVGPSRRTVGSRAEFTFKLINRTSGDLNDIRATVVHDGALTPREATADASKQARSLSWELGTIAAGNGVMLQVEFECGVAAEHATIQLRVSGHDVPDEQSEFWLTVGPIKGILDLQISDAKDPLSLGDVIEYVISTRNRGLQEARDIRLQAQLSANLRIVSAEVLKGDNQLNVDYQVSGHLLRFDSVASLGPDEVLRFTVLAKTLRSGEGTLRASLTHSASTVPVDVTEFSTINP